MKSSAQKALALAVGIAVIMSIGGCEEQNLSDTKRARLIGVENIQLKNQIKQHGAELEEQKQLLDKCLQEKMTLEARLRKELLEQANRAVAVVIEENQKLREENKNLKAQTEELKKELEVLKRQPGLQPL